MASTRSRRVKKQEDCFGELKEGIQRGLFRLVTDNRSTVAEMLSLKAKTPVPDLCEKCAAVMKQQKLVPSSFLALYFDDGILSPHAAILGKSPKGNSTTLAERIANVWARNKPDMFDHPWAARAAAANSNKRHLPDFGAVGQGYVQAYGGVDFNNPYKQQRSFYEQFAGFPQSLNPQPGFSGMSGQPIGGNMAMPYGFNPQAGFAAMQQQMMGQTAAGLMPMFQPVPIGSQPASAIQQHQQQPSLMSQLPIEPQPLGSKNLIEPSPVLSSQPPTTSTATATVNPPPIEPTHVVDSQPQIEPPPVEPKPPVAPLEPVPPAAPAPAPEIVVHEPPVEQPPVQPPVAALASQGPSNQA